MDESLDRKGAFYRQGTLDRKGAFYRQGSFLGSVLLIAGCCMGGAMLGLPLATGLSGFLPSCIALTLAYAFMVTTGLCLVECCLFFDKETNLVSMTRQLLGPFGSLVCWICYLFLFFSLLVAYTTGSSALIQDACAQYLSLPLSNTISTLLVVTFVGLFIAQGTHILDQANRILMLGLVVTYAVLVSLALPQMDRAHLLHVNLASVAFIMPPFITSFGFHNLIPGLCHYLQHDRQTIRRAVVVGSAIPFVMYMLWQMAFLGVIPPTGPQGFTALLDRGVLPAQILRQAVTIPWISEVCELFSLFAILTSFLAVAYAMKDFLADGLGLKSSKRLIPVVLGLPFVMSLVNPGLFMLCLNLAGGIFAIILYGILPVSMIVRGNIAKKSFVASPLVCVLILLISLGIIGLEILQEMQ